MNHCRSHTIFWPTNCWCEPKNTRPLLGQTNILCSSAAFLLSLDGLLAYRTLYYMGETLQELAPLTLHKSDVAAPPKKQIAPPKSTQAKRTCNDFALQCPVSSNVSLWNRADASAFISIQQISLLLVAQKFRKFR